MAIFDKFVVEVRVDGKPLEEFEPPEDDIDDEFDTELIERYIQSHPGKSYAVSLRIESGLKFTNPKKWDTLGFRVSVDGQFIKDPLYTKKYESTGKSWSKTVIGREHYSEAGRSVQKLRFQALEAGRFKLCLLSRSSVPTRIDESAILTVNSIVPSMRRLSTVEVQKSRKKAIQKSQKMNDAEKFSDAAIPAKLLKGQYNDAKTQ